MPVRISEGGSSRSVCKVADISMHGARLETYSMLARKAVIWIGIPGQPARKAEIVWSDEFTAACKFDQPLDEDMLTELVHRFGYVVEPNRPVEAMVTVA